MLAWKEKNKAASKQKLSFSEEQMSRCVLTGEERVDY
jgi:hypothetical protein